MILKTCHQVALQNQNKNNSRMSCTSRIHASQRHISEACKCLILNMVIKLIINLRTLETVTKYLISREVTAASWIE